MGIERNDGRAGARPSKRHRIVRAFERTIACEALLLGAMVVVFAILSAAVILQVAAFGAHFASSMISTM